MKTPERRHLRRSTVFLVNFEHISHLLLVFLSLTLNKQMLPGSGLTSQMLVISQYQPFFEKQYKFMTLRVLFYQLTAGRRRRSINSVKHAVGTGSGIIKRPMLRNFNCISRSRPKKYLFLQPLRSNIKTFQDLQA